MSRLRIMSRRRAVQVAFLLLFVYFLLYLLPPVNPGTSQKRPVIRRPFQSGRYLPKKTIRNKTDIDRIEPLRKFNLTIWVMDYHISTIWDLKTYLHPFGVKFIDRSLSGACGETATCGRYLLRVAPPVERNKEVQMQFYEAYKDDDEMKSVDAFVCYHPAGMCETYIPFKKPIIVIASTRYEMGRHNVSEWEAWNEKLVNISKMPGSLVAANNKYDAEYMKYFVKDIQPEILQSWCGYPENVYNPSRKEFLLKPTHTNVLKPHQNPFDNSDFLRQIYDVLLTKNDSDKIDVVRVRDKYPFYTYDDIVAHPAVIFIPYQVSTMSIFELYRMEVPMLFPTKQLLLEWQHKYHVMCERTWDMVLNFVIPSKSVIPGWRDDIPDPNDEVSKEAIEYWINFSDFYVLPHIVLYDSAEDLVEKLQTTDFRRVSRQMHQYNLKLKAELNHKWDNILYGIAKARGKI